MGGTRIWLVALAAAAGCGRLGFDPLFGDGDGDAGGDRDATTLAALGESCEGRSCEPDLRCLLGTCSCLQELKSDEFQTCTLSPGGVVSCVGQNSTGQLGRGTVGGSAANPAPVINLPGDIVEVDLGAFHACARTGAGELYCWGQFDTETATGDAYPVAVGEPVVQIASGGFHTCVRGKSGAVYCLGRDADGQLGRGSTGAPDQTPAAVPQITDAVDLASGGFHSCAIRADNTVSCWGLDTDGQIGDGAVSANQPDPVAVTGLDRAVQLSLGDFHSCARRDDGSVHCWGRNSSGQLGAQTVSANRPTAAAVAGVVKALDLYTGDDSACAIEATGEAVCWGNNNNEHLVAGGGDPLLEATPTGISGGLQDVAIGRRHTCFLVTGADVECAGTNSFGELGVGTMTTAEALGQSQLSCGP